MKNQKETIRKVVGELNNTEADGGGFWLPNIQRQFVWREDQIERLFDSIMRQYPISTLLIWRSRSEIKHRKFIDVYKPDLRISDFNVPSDTHVKRLVLDGQQRLQSLFIGLKGSYDGRELYFDVLSGDIVSPEDVRYRFHFLTQSQAEWPWINFKTIVFNNQTNNQLTKEICALAPKAVSDTQKDRIAENLDRCRMEFSQDDNLAFQELDSLEEKDAYNENDVVEIFIRANSGGTRLGKSDLLFSLLASNWEEADIELEELLANLNRPGYAFDRDFVLKTCLTLLDRGAQYEVRKFRDGSTQEEIVQKWKGISQAICDVKDFLYGKTYIRHDKALPSYLVLIPLIYFRYHFPDRWDAVRGADEYLLRSLLAGSFSGSPDVLIDRCTRTIQEDGDFKVDHIFETIRSAGRSLEISPASLLSFCYGEKELHLLFNLWYREFQYQPAYVNNQPQVDHIFPQSKLKEVKDVSPVTSKRSILHYGQEARDQIANCMLLTAKENGAGGKTDTPPEEWFPRRVQEEGEGYLDLHLIPKDRSLWKLDKFDNFIEERKKLILEKFRYMLIKQSEA